MSHAPAPDLDSLLELNPRRVCLVKPSSLGDIVHALPVLACLRDRWPQARITWVVNQGLKGLVDGHPALDEVITFDRKGAGGAGTALGTLTRLASELRSRRFDLTIDLQGLLRSALMTAATASRIRVGLGEAREGATAFYSHIVPIPNPEEHAVDKLLRVAAAFGADIRSPRFQVALNDADLAWARERLATIGGPRLVLNVGARWLTKRWPPAHFAEVARRTVERFGARLIAVGAPEDRELVEELRSRLGPIPVLDLCGQTSLPRLAAVAKHSDLFLSNDTGPLHLATATGVRTIGVYTCTSPGRTGPYGTNATAITSCVWCAPSYVKTCDRLECMSELTPDRVWPVVAAQLASVLAEGASAA